MAALRRCRYSLLLALTACVNICCCWQPLAWCIGGRATGWTSQKRLVGLAYRRSHSGRSPKVDLRSQADGQDYSQTQGGVRRLVASAGLCALVASCWACNPQASHAKRKKDAVKDVDIYFGAGNFWHLQHEFVMKEALSLSRREGDISSLTGYAGGTRVGDLDRVCYSGILFAPDHVSLGHAQVVRLSLPPSSLPEFTELFLDEVERRKQPEQGSQFRACIGLRGGVDSKDFAPIREVCERRGVSIVKAKGDEPDNYGKSSVYVYNSKLFPWRPAEQSNQFKDDPPERYESDYKELGRKLTELGVIMNNSCITN
eukprot:TRINITY_DN17876_c0_g1_i1.p1 TRINITY_DN17876_c0_g1~~TRINITY_DN17876_c0_g1_i1.p1  ORF type:complete len:323 (-),score=44.07 TRINITY_DN17876_c0_g1_i1:136-1077(-)